MSPRRSAFSATATWVGVVLAARMIQAIAAATAAPAHALPQDPFAGNVAQTSPRTPLEEQKLLHLPDGFEIQLVASEPAIHKPMNLAFDDRGRLWVTDSVEYPFPAPAGRTARDTVKILEDTDGDGTADKVTTFADGLNIPIGLLPTAGGAIVYSIPNVYRLVDSDGDDRADRREVLFGPFGFGDTHGMVNALTWGFDGWIYMCHGFANTSEVRAPDGSQVRMNSGNTFRIRPDGSRVEQYTHGQVNPFGLTLDPLGNLYSADCHSRPAYQLLRGAHYPSFGKPHDGLGFGPEMCFHDHGSTGISGIAYYAADQFPPAYRDTLFIGNPVTNRINHDRIAWTGTTPRAVLQPDFLRSEDPWFRPVDLELGPDGALYVADFYNRIIGHYEVPLTHPGRDRERGRIWRIVYRGRPAAPSAPPPRTDWTKATAAELVADLGHPNLAVRIRAANQWVTRRDATAVDAVSAAMQSGGNSLQRMHGLWVLERLGKLDAAMLGAAAADPERGVRVHAMHILADRSDWTAETTVLVRERLHDPDPFVQRAAAAALGRHASAAAIRPLLELRQRVPPGDTHLLHVVRMALRDQLRTAEAWQAVAAGPWSDADRSGVADVAAGVPSPEAAAFLWQQIQSANQLGPSGLTWVHHTARYGSAEVTTQLVTLAQQRHVTDRMQQVAWWREIDRGLQARGSGPREAMAAWASRLATELLDSKHAPERLAGAELAGAQRLDDAKTRLTAIVRTGGGDESLRRAACTSLVAIDPDQAASLLGMVLRGADEASGLREHVAVLLGSLNLPAARDQLVEALRVAPERLQGVIAFALAGTRAGAEQLLENIAAGKAAARLLLERPIHLRLAQHQLPQLDARIRQLTAGLPSPDQRLQQLLHQRRTEFRSAARDSAAGARVFKQHCMACHQLGGAGSKVGPQLDGIGVRGLDRLLEDTLDPSRNVDQAFRATNLALKDGRVLLGLLLREEGEVLVVADAQGQEQRIAKSDIEEKALLPLSPMPANFQDRIPADEFYHLLAFLLSQRGTAP